MKKLLLLILVIQMNVFGQNAIPGTSQFGTLMNNYQTNYESGNDMFGNWSTGVTKTFIPKNNNTSPIFSGSFWIGGYDQTSALHVSAETYRQTGVDFWPGPIDTANVKADSTLCNSFDTFFPIYKSQVDSQKNHLYSTIPQQIINWPGNGLSTFHTSYKLAPYVDVNYNGMYDPTNGDYPIMFGDYSIYQIFNDIGNSHKESGGAAFGIETHATHYKVDCISDSALWNTMFTHYELINRSPNTYHNFNFTMWLDFDLGNYQDDYTGCDTSLNLFYVYNGDGFDESFGSLTGYHQYLPAFGGMFLNQKMSTFTQFYNTGDPVAGNPVGNQTLQYYNCMNDAWKNGTPVTYGGNGQSAGQPTKYMFSGDPVANIGWTEANSGQVKGDVRGLGSAGLFTMLPHDTLKIDFAYIFARDYQNPNDSVAPIIKLKQYAQSIQNYYNANSTPCGSIFSSHVRKNGALMKGINIYPNPANNSLNISSPTEFGVITIYNSLGEIVLQATNKPTPNPSPEGNTVTIDISKLSAGIYIINANGSRIKFIKE